MNQFPHALSALETVYEWLMEIESIHYPFDKRPFKEWISRPDDGVWVMFANPLIKSLKEAQNSHRPNLSLFVGHFDFSTLYMGITYNTNPSVQVFEGLASPAGGSARKELLAILRSISPEWKFKVNRKRKLDQKETLEYTESNGCSRLS